MGDSAHSLSCIEEALRLLGVRSFVLGIQNPCFPARADEDTGRGSPYSAAGLKFARFLRSQGFTGIQFGPQGLTHEHSPSPYESMLFSRDPLAVSLERLTEEGLCRKSSLGEAVRRRPPGSGGRVPYGYVYRVHRSLLQEACTSFRDTRRLRRFAAANDNWLPQDSLFDLLRCRYGRAGWRQWRGPWAEVDRLLFTPRPGMEVRCRERRQSLEASASDHLAGYRLVQFLAHSQHLDFKERANGMGLKLYGDLQIGFSDGDVWSRRSLFLPRYRLGAPPSRTNPEGQPWDYPVLHPDLYRAGDAPGPAAALLALRMEKMFREYDGVRIDHPHGLVCPWVYRADTADPHQSVRNGTRLFASPRTLDHPDLAPFAIPSLRQINAGTFVKRYADDWVRELDEDQVERYALLFDVVVASAHAAGKALADLVPEVLSTLPYPLRRVLERHGLGRFRITQKADLSRADDVYRSENAGPGDWIMVGNHDTKPLWQVIEEWERQGTLGDRAAYLASRLSPPGRGGETLRQKLAADPGMLAQAQFADLFASPAANVMVFFTDFFGIAEPFNRPGTVSEENWSLRLPADYHRAYGKRLKRDRAFNVPLALAMALGPMRGSGPAGLRQRLYEMAGTDAGGR
jgi:4-alpha-glucanotransferase